MNYRDRIYGRYAVQWEQTHSCSRAEFDFYARISRKRFVRLLPPDKDARILDIACGTGHFLYFLKKEGYRNIRGIDISPAQLQVARDMGVSEVEETDFLKFLSRVNQRYDFIVANDILEHMSKDEVLKFLDLIHAALVPGGAVLMSTVNAASPFGAEGFYGDFTHETGFSVRSLTTVIQICGFSQVNVHGEEPLVYDLRSFLRTLLWKLVKLVYKVVLLAGKGTGRGLWKHPHALEGRIFALARKPR